MAGSVLVDITIGVVLLYLLVALFCTAVQEWIAQLFDMRARHLKDAIAMLLGGSTKPNETANAVLGHPLVKMLAAIPGKRTGPKDPSYLESPNFANALVAHVLPPGQAQTVQALKAGVDAIAGNDSLKQSLSAIVQRALGTHDKPEDQLRAAMSGIEAWFDSAMGHASGWYKRKVRGYLLIIAGTFAIVFNADSFQVALALSADAQLRSSVAAMAAQVAPVEADPEKQLETLKKQTEDLMVERNVQGGFGSLPVGWNTCGARKWWNPNFTTCYPGMEAGKFTWNWFVALLFKVLGLTMTTLAAALGAPFWFGLLQQLNAIRAAGPKPPAR